MEVKIITIKEEQDIVYETPEGLYFNKAIILFMIGVGSCLFCCGLSIAGIVLYRYKKEKAALLEKIRSDEIAPWEGEVLQGEDITAGKTAGYGEAVLDFYGNQADGRTINLGQVVGDDEEEEEEIAPNSIKKSKMKSGKIQPGGKTDIDRLAGVEVDPFAPKNLGGGPPAAKKKKKKKRVN